ncbi:MAG: DegT/DnrJ/EryC1/StrS family aminotransferase [Balneolaceae bacterium]|nr:DegT/DnrJ/EryC1/StrS family aminotransferase [Balneolaceae bacterium]
MKVPLLDLHAQYKSIKSEVKSAIDEVLESQYFIMGDTVKRFEAEIADNCNATHAFGCASGSDALLLALMAIDIKPGEYVITTPFTFFATAGAISRLGAIPVFADIDPTTFNIDPNEIEAILNGEHPVANRLAVDVSKIRAIIPVHLYGQMAEMTPIMELAKMYDLYVIEDAAQAIGSKYKGKIAGEFGDFGCFSFFPSKNLGAYGDGGLITIKDAALAEKVDILRTHGARPKYHNIYVGMNSRLDAMQAAILSVKLPYLDEWSQKRREAAQRYNALFEEHGITSLISECSSSCVDQGNEGCALPENKLVLPSEIEGAPENDGKHIYHQYTVRVKNRDEIIEALKNEGIGSAVYYPVPMHMQKCYSDMGFKSEDFPKSVCAANQALSLPIYPEITPEQQEYVVSKLTKILSNYA